jgi:hypothetical protein
MLEPTEVTRLLDKPAPGLPAAASLQQAILCAQLLILRRLEKTQET